MISGVIRRATGFSEVIEKNNTVVISGVSAENLSRDMRKIWATSKIASSMFIKVSWTEIVIPSFFALELRFILNKLLSERGMYTTKRILRNIIEGIETNTWVARTLEKPQPWFDWSKLDNAFIYDKLLPHQMDFLKKYEETVLRYGLKGMLLAAAPGAGKSINGCALALVTNAEKVIVICPKNASIRVWQKTLNKEFKTPQYPYVAELDGAIQPAKKWHIFHYEALDRAVELAKLYYGKNVCIILDESHNFNEIKSLRTQRLLEVCRVSGSKNIVWASGTPIKAIGFEAIPLLRSIDPLFKDNTETAFRKMFGKDAKRTLDILSHRLGLVTHNVPKQNFMPDEPETEIIKVKMPNSDKYLLSSILVVMQDFIKERTAFYQKHKKEYHDIYNECVEVYRKTIRTKEEMDAFKEYQTIINYLIKNGFDVRRDGDIAVRTNKFEKEKIMPTLNPEMKKKFNDAKSVVKYVDLKVRGECLGRILTKERIQCHVDMLEYVPFEQLIGSVKKKTLIFTSYVKIVDAVDDILTKKKYTPLKVYGDTNNDLVRIVNRFDSDPKVNPLIATYMSLSTAVPLTMANGIIFLNNPWRSYEKEQAIARAHRIGQDEPVYCFDIILDTGKAANISSRSLDIMQWSKDQVDAIMGIQGDVSISVESNGFIHEERHDCNEFIEDVVWDESLLVDNVTVSLSEDKEFNTMPDNYRFYSQNI